MTCESNEFPSRAENGKTLKGDEVPMRTRDVVLSSAFAAAVLLAATGAMAADPLPTSCTTFPQGLWTVEIVKGPCALDSATSTDCSSTPAAAGYAGIEYKVTGTADHVATVVTANNVLATLNGNQTYDPCLGDPVTGLGKYSCHEKAVKLNPLDFTQQYWLVVEGQKGPVLQSVAVKKGGKTEACAIAGFGEVSAVAPVTETIKDANDQCAVEFTLDQITGKVLHAQLSEDSLPDCKFYQTSVEDLSLEVNTPIGTCSTPPCKLGFAKFGNGYVNSGSASCTTRIIGGRVYTWGSPCPQ